MTVTELCERVVGGVAHKAATALVTKVLEDKIGQPFDWAREPAAAALLASGLRDGADTTSATADDLGCHLELARPIVAIGAPVAAYMPSVAQGLHTELIIPPHADVANAVGAIVGGVVQRVPLKIERLPGEDERLRVFLPDGWCDFATLADAAAHAERVMIPYAESLARRAGAEHVEVTLRRQDHWVRAGGSPAEGTPRRLYLGSELVFTAAGRPAVVPRSGSNGDKA